VLLSKGVNISTIPITINGVRNELDACITTVIGVGKVGMWKRVSFAWKFQLNKNDK